MSAKYFAGAAGSIHLLTQHHHGPDLVEAVGDQSEPGQAGYHYGDYDAIGPQRSACSTEISMCHDRHPYG